MFFLFSFLMLSAKKEGRQMFSLLNMKPKIMAPMLKGRTM
jgi:hypothetical protein